MVFAPLILTVIIGSVYMVSEQEFFSVWSCDTINNYLLQIDVPEDIPNHSTLTENQHQKLHSIHQQCVESTPFTTNQHK